MGHLLSLSSSSVHISFQCMSSIHLYINIPPETTSKLRRCYFPIHFECHLKIPPPLHFLLLNGDWHPNRCIIQSFFFFINILRIFMHQDSCRFLQSSQCGIVNFPCGFFHSRRYFLLLRLISDLHRLTYNWRTWSEYKKEQQLHRKLDCERLYRTDVNDYNLHTVVEATPW